MTEQLSDEIRLLTKKWVAGSSWPKRLNYLEVKGIRGWSGQRLELNFPIIAIVGENGSGKSTLLQAAASVYRSKERKRTRFASDFFPNTAWDKVKDASIAYGVTQGANSSGHSIRKLTERWLGNVDRPVRETQYIDLSRIQPVSARVGYAKIAKTRHKEKSAKNFDPAQLKRLSAVLGRKYESARMALSTVDDRREIPIIAKGEIAYSGFHQGSGETTVAELLKFDFPEHGLILIDEIESSLHPRAQRRLIRDLAEKCRQLELQIICTTHSPYILEELPLDARKYILDSDGKKSIVSGVSPQFAMSKMDDKYNPECDVYVEDDAARILVSEILQFHAPTAFVRCSIVAAGAANVVKALGGMAAENRFARPTCVFLDGDIAPAKGCGVLPGGDAPEQVVFNALQVRGWGGLDKRVSRDYSMIADALSNAMTLPDHHDWVRQAANSLRCGGEVLWRAMCAEWAEHDLSPVDATSVTGPIESKLP